LAWAEGSGADAVARDAHIHEIVAHATELDRILGYEANYAGTSFVKAIGLGQAQIRLEADEHQNRRRTMRALWRRSASTTMA